MPGLCHWGPLVAITIITTVALSSTYSALQLWSLPQATVKYFRRAHFYFMYIWLVPIFWNFLIAVKGPGFVPLGWKPENPADEKCLQFCRVCQGFKPPRSHHCKVCKRCSPKMDHHCPWINSCVGHANHAYFIRFLFFVPFGCLHGVVVNSFFLYHLLDYQFVFHPPYMDINTGWILFAVTGISFGAGTALGVFILFATQIKTIVVNRTQIEDWILEKANHRRRSRNLPSYVYPYHLGWYKNFTQVINLSGKCKGDGFSWPVREGCSKYSFTLEQLELKKLKRERSVACRIEAPYSGYRCPIFSFGIMTALRFPCCAEGRISVGEGDMMAITRWHGKWVYGRKILSEADTAAGMEIKGWFPRGCLGSILKDSSSSSSNTPSSTKHDSLDASQNSDTETSDHSSSEFSETDNTDSEPELVKKARRSPSPARKLQSKKVQRSPPSLSPPAGKSPSKKNVVDRSLKGSVVAGKKASSGRVIKGAKVGGKEEDTPIKGVGKEKTSPIKGAGKEKTSPIKGAGVGKGDKGEVTPITGVARGKTTPIKAVGKVPTSPVGGIRKRTKKITSEAT